MIRGLAGGGLTARAGGRPVPADVVFPAAVFFGAGAFLVVDFAGVFLAGAFLAVGAFLVVFLAGSFFTVFFALVFLRGAARLPVVFFAAVFLRAEVLAEVALVGFLAVFLAEVLRVVFFATVFLDVAPPDLVFEAPRGPDVRAAVFFAGVMAAGR